MFKFADIAILTMFYISLRTHCQTRDSDEDTGLDKYVYKTIPRNQFQASDILLVGTEKLTIAQKKVIKQKKVKRVRKRTIKRNKINKVNNLKIYGLNSAGIKCKVKSFNDMLLRLSPQIWMLEETKLKPSETIKCEALDQFQVFYLNRQSSQGGGLALGVTKDMESTLIKEGDDDTEAMAVQVRVGDLELRIVLAYGPQENALKDKKDRFWNFIEEEYIKAELHSQGFVLQMDGNLHAGKELLKNDPNPQNKNGRIFMDFLERNPSLIVVNALNICEGLITRRRDVLNKTEQAVLDFFVVNERMRPFLKSMLIDEERKHSLYNFSQIKQNKRVVPSDHNPIILDLNIEFCKLKPERREMFNLKNKLCQEAFKIETENNPQLLNIFNSMLPFDIQCKQWFKLFNSILHKCFKKVRIVSSKKKEKDNTEQLFKERIMLQKQVKEETIDENVKSQIEDRIKQIEDGIGQEVSEEFVGEVVETLRALGGNNTELGGTGRKEMWRLLKEKFPKQSPPIPVGKKDKAGNLITNHEGLKKLYLYLDTYLHRLRNRPIKAEFEDLKLLKSDLFDMRLELAQSEKSKPWNMNQLEKVLNALKN